MTIFFEDTFSVSTIDAEGKRFDKVSRATCQSLHDKTCSLTFDYHNLLLPLSVQDKIKVSFNTSDSNDTLGACDYATNNIIFKIEQKDLLTVVLSAGGLLTSISLDKSKMANIVNGQNVYIEITKIK